VRRPYIRSAFRLAFPRSARERVVVSLTAYFDEAGTHKGSPAVAVAGYIGHDRDWRVFESEWKRKPRVVSRLMWKIENVASGCLRLVESSLSAPAANAQHQPRAKRVGCMLKVRWSERKRRARCAR